MSGRWKHLASKFAPAYYSAYSPDSQRLARGLERAAQRRQADKEIEMALGDPEPLEEPENAVRTCGWCGHPRLCKPGEPARDSLHHQLCCLDSSNADCRTYKAAKPLSWRDRENFF